MARPSDYTDPEYDRRLAEFKERKKRQKQQEPTDSKKQN